MGRYVRGEGNGREDIREALFGRVHRLYPKREKYILSVLSPVNHKYFSNRVGFEGDVGKILYERDNMVVIAFLRKQKGIINIYKGVFHISEIKLANLKEARKFINLYRQLQAQVVAEKL